MAAAGTLTLTQNSATVTGSGTAFTTALAVGGFIVATVGGSAYTLGIKSIESNTSLTLQVVYNGPTAGGVAFDYVPLATLNLITSSLAAQVGYALRAANLDRNNWQQVYSASGNITVTLPDGSQYSGPSWNSVAGSVTGKMDKAQNLNDVANKSTALSNLGAVPVAGGTMTGQLQVNANIRTTNGVHAGGVYTATLTGTSMGWDTSNGVSTFQNNKGGGLGGYVFRLINADNTVELYRFQFRNDGVGLAPGGWVTGSDERIKTDIQDIDPDYALSAVLKLRHVTFKMRDKPDGSGGWTEGGRSAGYLAQDLEKYLPEVVSTDNYTYSCRGDRDELIEIKDMKSIDPGKAAAALNGAAIKALYGIIESQNAIINELQNRMKAIDGLEA